jgi:DNA-binding phage protein
MTLKLNKWHVLDHLKTEEDMTLYLEACFEEAGDVPLLLLRPWAI